MPDRPSRSNQNMVQRTPESLKVWSTVKIRRTRVPQNALVPVGRPRPYSIIKLNMRFIPTASLRASSQITASSYLSDIYKLIIQSQLALALTWSLACNQTDCITAGMLSNVGSVLGPRRRSWPNIKTALDQCLV